MLNFRAISTVLLAIACLTASAQRTTRRGLKAQRVAVAAEHQTPMDTVATSADSTALKFSGYEKTLRSATESFFITNLSGKDIDRIVVDIVYSDMKGRVLDRRTETIDISLPAAETRRADIRSRDRQHTFYYYRSPAPRHAAQATPYRVKISLIAALTERPDRQQKNKPIKTEK